MKSVSDAVKEHIENSGFSRTELRVFKQELRAENPERKITAIDLHHKLCRSARKAFRKSIFALSGMTFFQIPFFASPTASSLDWGFISFGVVLQICLSISISARLKDKPVWTQFKLVKLAVGLMFTFHR